MIQINQVKQWVKNIVLIVLFANFIEMLLPNSKFRGYIRVVIGFFVILVIIVPFIELLNFSRNDINLSLMHNKSPQNLQDILAAGTRLRQQEIKAIQKEYKEKLAKQLTAVIKLNSAFVDPKVDVIFNNQNEVKKIIIDTTAQRITPVQVDLKETEKAKNNKETQQQSNQLKQLLINLYGFDRDQIEVR